MLKWYTTYLRKQLRRLTPRHSLTKPLNFKGGNKFSGHHEESTNYLQRKENQTDDRHWHTQLLLVDNGIIYLNTQGNKM